MTKTTIETVELQPPDDDGTVSVDLELTWRLMSEAMAETRWEPRDPAEWDIVSIEVA